MLFWTRVFLLLMLLGQGVSCSTPKSTLDQVFDNTQLVTVNRIIDFYDNFVLSRTDKKLSIDKAYLDFLNTNCPKAIETGDLDILTPDRNDKVNFYKTFDREELSEIYVIQDTMKLFDRNKEEPINTYLPFSFRLNTQGKYVELLKLLATRNDFYKEYYRTVEVSGDISPGSYAMILKEYQKMDFKKKEERLVLIVNLLHSQGTMNE